MNSAPSPPSREGAEGGTSGSVCCGSSFLGIGTSPVSPDAWASWTCVGTGGTVGLLPWGARGIGGCGPTPAAALVPTGSAPCAAPFGVEAGKGPSSFRFVSAAARSCFCGAYRSLMRHPLTYRGSRGASEGGLAGPVWLEGAFPSLVSLTSPSSEGERRSMKGRSSSALLAAAAAGAFEARWTWLEEHPLREGHSPPQAGHPLGCLLGHSLAMWSSPQM